MNNLLEKLQEKILSSTRYNEILLAFLVVLIISLMIIPISPSLVDGLLAINLSMAAILLMMALYIPSIIHFSTFPSLLLFTTLFRLALNITTTRLILIKANAGDIIFTFGNFVVAGNFIVGAVIFLIILIVQFIVITKGAERVAEVAARFTLDAMPGKQMSIDADMRAGVIDIDQAKERRAKLEKENQLYGAMDGAMKFVKGDAIAGLIITAINIIAGLSIGVFQKDMTVVEAIQKYSILTIGDGLVTQIPALLIAMTAGVIVTRVTSEEEVALGGEIGTQLISQPKALIIGSCLVVLMGLIPGFPTLVFFGLASVLLVIGYTLFKKEKILPEEENEIPAMVSASQGEAAKKTQIGKKDEFSLTIPLMIDVAANVQEFIKPSDLNAELVDVRKALYHDLGVPFPGIHLRFNENYSEGIYKILVQEVPMSQGAFKEGHVFVREKPENLDIAGIPYLEEKPFLPKTASIWVDESLKVKLQESNITYMNPPQLLTFHLSFILKRYAADFIGIQESKFILENLEAHFPEIVREVQRVLPVQKITEVLQRLVQEEISIRNLRTIMQTLIEWGQKEKEPVLLTEYVRSNLRRYISYKFSAGQNILAVYLLEPDVEETIRMAVRQTSAGSYLALDPSVAKQLVENIKNEVGDISNMRQRPVLLTSMDVRRYLRKLIELELYELPVLSHQELTEEITIQPLGRIKLKQLSS